MCMILSCILTWNKEAVMRFQVLVVVTMKATFLCLTGKTSPIVIFIPLYLEGKTQFCSVMILKLSVFVTQLLFIVHTSKGLRDCVRFTSNWIACPLLRGNFVYWYHYEFCSRHEFFIDIPKQLFLLHCFSECQNETSHKILSLSLN